MRAILALLCALLLTIAFSQAPSDSADVATTIQQHCQVRWSNDYEMRAYCEKQQRNAVIELSQLSQTNGGIAPEAFSTAFRNCTIRWPGDYEMRAYCLRQQIQGYRQVRNSAGSIDSTVTPTERATIERLCGGKWPNDYEMQAYCERRQREGLLFKAFAISS